MKISNHTLQKDKVVNVRQTHQEKQQLINRIRMHKGHKLFEYNIETSEIKEAAIEAMVHYQGKTQKKVVANKNCLYVSALNEKNALKKLLKRYKK